MKSYEVSYRGEVIAVTHYPSRFLNSARCAAIVASMGRHYTYVVRLNGRIVAEYADIRVNGRIA